MKTKYLAVAILASLLSGMSVPANAVEKQPVLSSSSTSNVANMVSLAASTINDLKARKTFEFATPNGTYISLGESYFSKSENQGIALNSGFGTCVTDNRGCWSSAYGSYLPILVDKNKLASYAAIHPSSLNIRVSPAGAGNVLLGIAGLVSAVAAGVVLVAATPVLSVVGVATTVGLFAAFVGGAITACQSLAGKCR